MIARFFKISFLLVFLTLAAQAVSAQDASLRLPPLDPQAKEKEDVPKNIREMLIKKRIEQDKKDYDELLQKGQEAADISEKLEKTFAQNNQISATDMERLDYLSGLVKKIRKDIGGSDDSSDDEAKTADSAEEREDKPSTLQDAFKALQSTTVKLVDELKKTTRFSISAIAIQSSNSVLRIVRFIRGGK